MYFEEHKPWYGEKATAIKATLDVTLNFGMNMRQHEPDNVNIRYDTIPVTIDVGNDYVISYQENSKLHATQSSDHHISPTPASTGEVSRVNKSNFKFD